MPRNGVTLPLLMLILAAGIGYAVHAGARTPGDERLLAGAIAQITQAGQSPTRRILLTGDSHAGALAGGPICGQTPLNGAMGGLTAPLALDAWKAVGFARHSPRAIVLAIGTNDQQTKRDPERHDAEFRATVSELVDLLLTRTDRLTVLAIPPNHHPLVSVSGLAERNAWLADLCKHKTCRFLDPFSESRESDGQTMKPGYSKDGVHYTDYQPYRQRLDKEICSKKHTD